MQEKLAHNQQTALRNTQHPYLLRGHVCCGCASWGLCAHDAPRAPVLRVPWTDRSATVESR